MALTKAQRVGIPKLLRAARTLVELPENHFTVDYDRGADVLYLSYGPPRKATDADEVRPGIILRYRRRRVIGVTILDASKR